MDRLVEIYNDLKGPRLVAKFQKRCGVRRVLKKTDDKNECTEHIEIENKLLHRLFSFATALGDEDFYSICFPFWFWSVDGAVGRRVVLVWAICMYIGQGLKDLIRWPRPSSPPVVKMERKWELEYGMPSTHAIVASAVPLSIITFTSYRYQFWVELGIVIALTICALVCLSRIYLGMHSVLDIIAGLTLVAFLLPVVIPIVDNLDPFFFTHELGGLTLVAGGMLVCFCYPMGDRWTPARGDTYVIVGSAVGLNLGCWMNYHMGYITGPPVEDPPYAVMWPTYSMIALAIVRQILGLVILLFTKIVVKKAIRKLIKYEESSGKPGIGTELITKYLTYVIIAFNITHTTSIIFRVLGLQRPSFHTEI